MAKEKKSSKSMAEVSKHYEEFAKKHHVKKGNTTLFDKTVKKLVDKRSPK